MIKQTAFKILLGLFLAVFITVGCNNKSEKKTETDTTQVQDTMPVIGDTTLIGDTLLKGKPTEQGDRPPPPPPQP